MKPSQTAVVITSIQGPDNPVLIEFANQCQARGWMYFVAGDIKSPQNFSLPGCQFLSVETQNLSEFALAKVLPFSHYSRKNLGYLNAIKNGAKLIIETDDDNYPLKQFWENRQAILVSDSVTGKRWINAYDYFTEHGIWPRGFALRDADALRAPTLQTKRSVFSPVQQSLANGSPDIDALQRLQEDIQLSFNNRAPLVLAEGSICPFNSQNTTWFSEAFVLLYLPSTCSFRMCDIWRSFIAQRVMHSCGWLLSFHSANVFQKRNPHDLMLDLDQEIEGYVHNESIVEMLFSIYLAPGRENLQKNLIICYQAMVDHQFLSKEELDYLKAWLFDFNRLSH